MELLEVFCGEDSAQVFHRPLAALSHPVFGYQPVDLLARGVGGSDGSTTSIGYHEALDVADAFERERDRSGDAPIILFGYSGGAAAIARAVGTQRLRPHALILETCFDTLLGTVSNRFGSGLLCILEMWTWLVFTTWYTRWWTTVSMKPWPDTARSSK